MKTRLSHFLLLSLTILGVAFLLLGKTAPQTHQATTMSLEWENVVESLKQYDANMKLIREKEARMKQNPAYLSDADPEDSRSIEELLRENDEILREVSKQLEQNSLDHNALSLAGW
ncbi:MAG: hypothetical protein AAGI38_22460 [Bacteroidota bacterium]